MKISTKAASMVLALVALGGLAVVEPGAAGAAPVVGTPLIANETVIAHCWPLYTKKVVHGHVRHIKVPHHVVCAAKTPIVKANAA